MGGVSDETRREKEGRVFKKAMVVIGLTQRPRTLSSVATASHWKRWLTVWRLKRHSGQVASVARPVLVRKSFRKWHSPARSWESVERSARHKEDSEGEILGRGPLRIRLNCIELIESLTAAV